MIIDRRFQSCDSQYRLKLIQSPILLGPDAHPGRLFRVHDLILLVLGAHQITYPVRGTRSAV